MSCKSEGSLSRGDALVAEAVGDRLWAVRDEPEPLDQREPLVCHASRGCGPVEGARRFDVAVLNGTCSMSCKSDGRA